MARLTGLLIVFVTLVTACAESWDINDSISIESTIETCGLIKEANHINQLVIGGYAEKEYLQYSEDLWFLASISSSEAHPDLSKAVSGAFDHLYNLSDQDKWTDLSIRATTICRHFDLWDLPTTSFVNSEPIFDPREEWER